MDEEEKKAQKASRKQEEAMQEQEQKDLEEYFNSMEEEEEQEEEELEEEQEEQEKQEEEEEQKQEERNKDTRKKELEEEFKKRQRQQQQQKGQKEGKKDSSSQQPAEDGKKGNPGQNTSQGGKQSGRTPGSSGTNPGSGAGNPGVNPGGAAAGATEGAGAAGGATTQAAGAAAKGALSGLGVAIGWIIGIILLLLAFLIIAVGIYNFFITVPGLMMDKITEFSSNMWGTIQSMFEGNEKKIKEEDEVRLATYLQETMGYDLYGFGFGKVEEDEEGNITKVIDNYLAAYLLADYNTYTIEGKVQENITNFLDTVLFWRKHHSLNGMIKIDYSGSWDWLKNQINQAVEIDRETKTMTIGVGLWKKNYYSFNMDGWSGRYGKPLEFLLTMHLATMAPDIPLTIAGGEEFDTKVHIELEETTAYIKMQYAMGQDKLEEMQADEYYSIWQMDGLSSLEGKSVYQKEELNLIAKQLKKFKDDEEEEEESSGSSNSGGGSSEKNNDGSTDSGDIKLETPQSPADSGDGDIKLEMPQITTEDGDEDIKLEMPLSSTNQKANVTVSSLVNKGEKDDVQVTSLAKKKDKEEEEEEEEDNSASSSRLIDILNFIGLTEAQLESANKINNASEKGKEIQTVQPYITYVENAWYRNIYFVRKKSQLSEEEKADYPDAGEDDIIFDAYKLDNTEREMPPYNFEPGDGTEEAILGQTTQGGKFQVIETRTQVRTQVQQPMKGKMNQATKELFVGAQGEESDKKQKKPKYYIYDGSEATAKKIDELKQKEAEFRAQGLDGEELSQAIEKEQQTDKTKVYRELDIKAESLSAIVMLENMKSKDADFALRDFKELLVELEYFKRTDFEDQDTQVLSWMIPEYKPKEWPSRKEEKQNYEYGTFIKAKTEQTEEEEGEGEQGDSEETEEKENIGFEEGLEIINPGQGKIIDQGSDYIEIEFTMPDSVKGMTMYVSGFHVDLGEAEYTEDGDLQKGTKIGTTGTTDIIIILRDSKKSVLENVEDYMSPMTLKAGYQDNPIGEDVERWRDMVVDALAELGLDTSDDTVTRVLGQITNESSGDPYVVNLKDSNASKDCSAGVLQAIASTYNHYKRPEDPEATAFTADDYRAGNYDKNDPRFNGYYCIYACINYCAQRYGRDLPVWPGGGY